MARGAKVMDSRPQLQRLPAAALDQVFPFHLVLDGDLTIVQAGRSLRKVIGEDPTGQPLGRFFRIQSPAVPAVFSALVEQSNSIFLLASETVKLTLRGQMLQPDPAGPLLFLASPGVREMADVRALGLTLNDFAVHDTVIDFMVLLQTKQNALNDTRQLAEQLRNEIAVRREAEAALQAVNEQLEERVRERTKALTQTVAKLEAKNQEMTALNRMADLLQSCRTVEETFPVITKAVSDLFPTTGGVLSLWDDDEQHFDAVAAWGDAADIRRALGRDDCLALLRQKLHVHMPGDADPTCLHLRDSDPGHHACVPLHAHDQTVGHLQLHCDVTGMEADDIEAHRHLLQTVAEHAGLAIANLRLQEFLRHQSIRDPLTGLYNRRHMEIALKNEGARAQRLGLPVGLVMADIDHFKRFNDSFGHAAGDDLLRAVGAFLQTAIRGEDLACRYGGEEFLLILPGASLEGTQNRAEQIRSGIETEIRPTRDGKPLGPVTMSLGVAVLPTHGDDPSQVLAAADKALYKAKTTGRNRVCTAPEPPNKKDDTP